MTTVVTPPAQDADNGDVSAAAKAFAALLIRDVVVLGRELPMFLLQTVVQPIFLLFVFGTILGKLGFTGGDYADLLFPGVVAMALILASLQNAAIKITLEFGYTREIEDRLLAPLPTRLVAAEKIVFAALQGIFAGIVMFPVGWLELGHLPGRTSGIGIGLLIVLLVLGAWAGAAAGLALATAIPPQRVMMVFTLILTPLLFTGCAQYPWHSLSRIRWFQVISLVNPLTYLSEGMRAVLAPGVQHLNTGICVTALVVFGVVFSVLGIWGFERRAID